VIFNQLSKIGIDPAFKSGDDDESGNKVYPNPFKRNFYIETTDVGVARFQVINPSGQLILKGSFEGITAVDMTNCTPNYYFLSIFTKNGVSNHKILIN
jgi:hypothetical protein